MGGPGSGKNIKHHVYVKDIAARLVERYKNDSKLSMRELAREFNISSPTAKRILQDAGVEIMGLRPNIGEAKKGTNGFVPRAAQNPSIVAQVIAKRTSKQSVRSIAQEVGISVPTVNKILDQSEIDLHIRQGKTRIVKMLPTALDNLEAYLEDGDKQVSLELVRGTGVMKLTKDGDDGNQNSGGVTINLALLGQTGARQLLASLEGDRQPVVLDAEVCEDEGRAGHTRPVQAVPES